MMHAQPTNSFLLHHSPYAFAEYLPAESRHLVSHAIKILFSTSFHKAAYTQFIITLHPFTRYMDQ